MARITNFMALRWLALSLGVAFFFTQSPQALAYDIDTHFYEMYLLARYAGIGHDVAIELATFNQWIDESRLTTPLNPLILTGERMRRLFHFPTPLSAHYSYGRRASQHGVRVDPLDVAQENSPIAHEMIWTGLKMGNHMLVGAGMHVLMDSFGHSEFTPFAGHIDQGHAPDRPFQAYEKHRRMTKTLLRELATIRKALPQEALDLEFHDGAGPAHYKLSGDELFAKYDNNSDIQDVIKRDTLRDPRYTLIMATYIVDFAKKNQLIREDFDASLILDHPDFFADQPTGDLIVARVVRYALALPPDQRDQVLNMNTLTGRVMSDYHTTEYAFDHLLPTDEKEAYVAEFIRRITAHVVPQPLGQNQPVAFEHDQLPRATEMILRIGDRQALIEKLTGTRVAFDPPLFKKILARIGAAVHGGDPLSGVAELDRVVNDARSLVLAGSEIASPSSRQRWQWRWAIIKYQYLDLVASAARSMINKVVPSLSLTFGNSRFDASRGTFLYNRERAFALMMEKGIIQHIVTPESLTEIRREHAERNDELRAAGFDVDGAIGRLLTETAQTPMAQIMKELLQREPIAPAATISSELTQVAANAMSASPRVAPNQCLAAFTPRSSSMTGEGSK